MSHGFISDGLENLCQCSLLPTCAPVSSLRWRVSFAASLFLPLAQGGGTAPEEERSSRRIVAVSCPLSRRPTTPQFLTLRANATSATLLSFPALALLTLLACASAPGKSITARCRTAPAADPSLPRRSVLTPCSCLPSLSTNTANSSSHQLDGPRHFLGLSWSSNFEGRRGRPNRERFCHTRAPMRRYSSRAFTGP